MMAIRKVFIIWNHPLSLESVRRLLNHEDVEIIGETTDFSAALKEIDQLNPDTVIVEEKMGASRMTALSILESSQHVSRVIGFSLSDNNINIYQHEEITAGSAEDLLHLVRFE